MQGEEEMHLAQMIVGDTHFGNTQREAGDKGLGMGQREAQDKGLGMGQCGERMVQVPWW